MRKGNAACLHRDCLPFRPLPGRTGIFLSWQWLHYTLLSFKPDAMRSDALARVGRIEEAQEFVKHTSATPRNRSPCGWKSRNTLPNWLPHCSEPPSDAHPHPSPTAGTQLSVARGREKTPLVDVFIQEPLRAALPMGPMH